MNQIELKDLQNLFKAFQEVSGSYSQYSFEYKTELQNGCAWNAPLKAIWSNPPAHTGPPKTTMSGWLLTISNVVNSTISLGTCARAQSLPE